VFSLRGRENVFTLGGAVLAGELVISNPADGVYDRGGRDL
jgi:hypothetical protein